MANTTQLTLIGDKELLAAFGDLERRAQSGIVGKALRAASRPIVNAARDNLRAGNHKFTGNLIKSIGLRIKTYRKDGRTIAVIGPRWPEGAHGHLVEFGTGPRQTEKGKSTGFMPATPFLRPAFDAFKGAALQILTRLIRNGLIARRFKGD